jgi:D-serine deaminase-like pyridoxal phosphate-dependent protein
MNPSVSAAPISKPDLGANWFEFPEAASLASPALIIYLDRARHNLRQMVEMAGGPARLRPHIKTHKMRELIDMQLALGITKFKCATIAEAEVAATAGVPDLLFAYQPAGPTVGRFVRLLGTYPKTQFSAICDDASAIRALSQAASQPGDARPIELLLDIDVGQHRTGIPAGPQALELYRLIASSPGLKPGGLHAYDGHISEPDVALRKAACENAFAPVRALANDLRAAGLPVPRIVAGGTPTFPIHAKNSEVECSPGTTVFWDAGYLSKFPDMPFLPAALVMTRVVSKPGANRLCFDLGHKALGSEMPHPRVQFLNLPDSNAVGHIEEHLVVETPNAATFNVGDRVFGIPRHICPTVALHAVATVVENSKICARWKVAARDRQITI